MTMTFSADILHDSSFPDKINFWQNRQVVGRFLSDILSEPPLPALFLKCFDSELYHARTLKTTSTDAVKFIDSNELFISREPLFQRERYTALRIHRISRTARDKPLPRRNPGSLSYGLQACVSAFFESPVLLPFAAPVAAHEEDGTYEPVGEHADPRAVNAQMKNRGWRRRPPDPDDPWKARKRSYNI